MAKLLLEWGGADKGLQLLHGLPLYLHIAQKLSPQVASILISANRNLERYRQKPVSCYHR